MVGGWAPSDATTTTCRVATDAALHAKLKQGGCARVEECLLATSAVPCVVTAGALDLRGAMMEMESEVRYNCVVDGLTATGDGCSLCNVEQGYRCVGGENGGIDVCGTVCGDGLRAGQERCDDANLISGARSVVLELTTHRRRLLKRMCN
jgi:hypothetical protein